MNTIQTQQKNTNLSVCPLCASKHVAFAFHIGVDEIFDCKDCAFRFAVSPPVARLALYDKDYFGGNKSHGYQNYASGYRSHAATFSRRLREAERRLGEQGLLLDYGCAYGHLGKVALQRGWKVIGTDISFDAVKTAVIEHGIIGFVSDLTEPPLKKGLFDLVTLYDVIEHLPDPNQVLKKITPLINHRGYLHITTPDVKSISARMMGQSWYHYKEQEHLLYFSKASMRMALEKNAFEVVDHQQAPSLMTIYDILIRLKKYSGKLVNWALRFAESWGFAESIVRIHIGEMQTWARPKHPGLENSQPTIPLLTSTQTNQTNLSLLLPFLCCPNCEADLQLSQAQDQLLCQSCKTTFEVRDGIPILLRNHSSLNTQAA